MNPLLSHIKNYLKDDLKQYKSTFSKIMASNITLVDNVAKYIVRHRGKGLRPLLVLLSARLLGETNPKTYKVAAIVEILHTATLVHDDVVDEAAVRRGFPSVNAMWKNKISVLMGDYLLSKSLISATQTDSLQIMHILADTAKRLSKGELFQIEKSRKLNITEEEYLQLVSDKTAALISACCYLGAITVTDNQREHDALKSFGENLGIAFQIKDDLLDYEGKAAIVGKAVGADLKEKKITLPLILAFNKSKDGEKKFILKLLRKGVSTTDVKKIITFCDENDGIESARQQALVYAQKAKDSISFLPESLAKKNALMFVDYIVNRKK